jgi:nucleolar protein 14
MSFKAKLNANNKLGKNKFSSAPKPLNAFEKHILSSGLSAAKTKHKIINNPNEKIINKTIEKRSANNQHNLTRRRELLLTEFNALGKNNTFQDKRIAADNDSNSNIHRFQAERMKTFKRKGKFSLQEENEVQQEELTHGGQLLSSINYADDDERASEDEGDGRLSAEIVNEMNFGSGGGAEGNGNGTTRKPRSAAEIIAAATANQAHSSEPRSKKDIMTEIINKSKLFKEERQAEKANQLELINNLDDEFKDIRGLLEYKDSSNSTSSKKDQPADDYMSAVVELSQQAKAKATERLKSEAQLAQEAKQKLEELEKLRLSRMKQSAGQQPGPTSDDALQENYIVDKEIKKQRMKEKIEKANRSTIHSDDDDEDTAGAQAVEFEQSIYYNTAMTNSAAEIDAKLAEKFDSNAHSSDNIPYLFPMPNNPQQLIAILNHYPAAHHSIIVTRIRACYHMSLSPENRGKLERFQSILINYFIILADKHAKSDVSDVNPLFEQLNHLTLPIAELSQQFSGPTAVICREVLINSRKNFNNSSEISYPLPTVGELLAFQLFTQLFPTSDFRHNILTPLYLHLAEVLARATINSVNHICKLIFIQSLLINSVTLSKRLIPEVTSSIDLLLNLLFNQLDITNDNIYQSIAAGLQSQIAAMFSNQQSKSKKSSKNNKKNSAIEPLNFINLLKEGEGQLQLDSSLFQSIISSLLNNIRQLLSIYNNKEIKSFNEIFQPFLAILEHVQQSNKLSNYPALEQQIRELTPEISSACTSFVSTRRPLTLLYYTQPSALVQHTPQFVENFNPHADYDPIKQRAEIKQLQRKVKKEKAGAVKELRKDQVILEKEKARIAAAKSTQYEAQRKRAWTDLQQQATDTNILAKQSKKKSKK